jgi:hypothetical protein
MKRILLVIAVVTCLGVVAASAQELADYQKFMRGVNANNGALGKDLTAKSADASATDAKNLVEIFGQVHDFWQKKGGNDDAVKFAADAQAGFKQVADLAAAGKFDEAAAAQKTTAANCAGCHMAHRMRNPDGTFEMK